MLRRLLGEHIDLSFREGQTPLWIEADPGMMEQVVMNLSVNARDAMPKGGRLILSTQRVEVDAAHAQRNLEARTGAFALLAVKDGGCGMDAETLKRIFEPFFTTKDVGTGTGLGLATVYGIVKQHDGWVEVESQVGKGTVFRVYLPLANKAPEAQAEADDKTVHRHGRGADATPRGRARAPADHTRPGIVANNGAPVSGWRTPGLAWLF